MNCHQPTRNRLATNATNPTLRVWFGRCPFRIICTTCQQRALAPRKPTQDLVCLIPCLPSRLAASGSPSKRGSFSQFNTNLPPTRGEAHDSGVCPQRARCSGRRASVERSSVLVCQEGASVEELA